MSSCSSSRYRATRRRSSRSKRDHTVAIAGDPREVEEKSDKVFRLHERLEKHFERRFEFPPQADTKHLKAVLGNGVLELHAPKSPQVKPRKIAIGRR